jgi:hypothetical protein
MVQARPAIPSVIATAPPRISAGSWHAPAPAKTIAAIVQETDSTAIMNPATSGVTPNSVSISSGP